MKTRVDSITPSGGNAFADLGLPDAEERKIKVQLAVAINAQITRRRLTQLQAAERLGINQPKVSALLNYKLSGFSVERLMRFLSALNQEIEITIRSRPNSRQPGRIFVSQAA